jgi:SAM-dependent methyltransferase
LQKQWNSLGREDPFGAILSPAAGEQAKWDIAEFFQSGIWEVEKVLRYAESFQPLREKKSALDFGCGVGRLTQALAAHFEQACGVDISPAMIEHARQYNRTGDRCEFVVNDTADLARFAAGCFDFIYSSITLQHMPPRFARRYLVEFLRVLRPGGLLVFQLPSRRKGLDGALRSTLQAIVEPVLHPFAPRVVMRGIRNQEVLGLLAEHGGVVLNVASDNSAGPAWESYRYLVRKS